MAEEIEAVKLTLEADKDAFLAVEASTMITGGVYVGLNWNGAKGGVHLTREEAAKMARLLSAFAPEPAPSEARDGR